MSPFTMPKYLADNRVIVSLFVALSFVNSYAITANWY